ncbi:16285_t:CDS:2, partial [Dentiscutata erythropus]
KYGKKYKFIKEIEENPKELTTNKLKESSVQFNYTFRMNENCVQRDNKDDPVSATINSDKSEVQSWATTKIIYTEINIKLNKNADEKENYITYNDINYTIEEFLHYMKYNINLASVSFFLEHNNILFENRTNHSSNSSGDYLKEDASLYFRQKIDTTWGLLDFLQFRKKQNSWTKNKVKELELFKQCLLAETTNMNSAIEKFMLKKYNNEKNGPHIKGIFEEHPTIKLFNNEKSQNFKLLVSANYGTRQWVLESGIIYLPSLPWLNELLSTKDAIELKNNPSFAHQLHDNWWSLYFDKIQAKNKDLIFKDQDPFSIFCQRMCLHL